MRTIYVRERSGRIIMWATNRDGQGVYTRSLSSWNTAFREVEAPPATPVFRSRWHFWRWVRRHCHVEGLLVGHTGWWGPEYTPGSGDGKEKA